TPLESIPDLEPGIVEKLVAAGITTVEAVADMTPEQLEVIPGIGPKTVEKISIAVNNYFSSLESGEAAPTPQEEIASADEPGQSPGDTVEHPDDPMGETAESAEPPASLAPEGATED